MSTTSPPIRVQPMTTASDAAAFRAITEEWISRLFTMTDLDRMLLDDPDRHIVGPGGDVLLARRPDGTEALGCVALIAYSDHVLELSKMGVTPAAQGLGIGRRLVEAAVERARQRGARRLFLGTNSKLAPAIHLYEAAGFTRITADQLPVADYYARADVLMELRGLS